MVFLQIPNTHITLSIHLNGGYSVMEIQKFADGSIAVPPIATYESFFEAASRYHSILLVAAVSEVPVHSAVMLNDVGQEIRYDTFNHTDGQIE